MSSAGGSSDGFGKYTTTSDFSMQNTFMKNTVNSNSTMMGGFNVTGNAFKK
jgi:hypothetical protein